MTKKGHKGFAAVFDHFGDTDQSTRSEIAGGARGRVLEIGAGTGFNFRFYGDRVEDVIAAEPDQFMLRRAGLRARDASAPVQLWRASAEALPFEDASFDTVVSTWVLCSVVDTAKSLSEMRRVLRPKGQLRFAEHVRYRQRFMAFWQDLLAPPWRRLMGGCNPNRDIEGAILSGGFTIRELRHFSGAPPIPPFILARPHIRGVAVPAPVVAAG